MNTLEMEIALANHFNYRQNLIVPNVSWGMVLMHKPLHECDLLVLTASGYLWEVEIKISKQDLIADQKKKHKHFHPALKRLYFALPESMEDQAHEVPDDAVIILVKKKRYYSCTQIRKPKIKKGLQLNQKQRLKLAELGAMRIWGAKKKLNDIYKKGK